MNSIQASFKINLNILTIFRLYSREKPTCFHRVQCYLIYFVVTYPVPVTGLIYLLLNREFGDPQSGYDTFTVTQTGCHIAKLLPFVLNGERIKKCIHYLESPIFATEDEKHKKILKECSRICQRNTKVYLASVIFAATNFASKPFLEKEHRLPMNVWLPFDPDINVFVFYLIFVAIVAGVTLIVLQCVATDTLIGGLACLVGGHLEILQDILKKLDEINSEMSIKNKIKYCVRYHNAILSFVKEYEECFSPVVFSQLSGSVLVTCFCCFQMIKAEPLTLDFFNLLSILLTYLAQIYFYCYFGSVLHDQSDKITTAIYMSKWYEYDKCTKKYLIQIMERSKRPISLTVGKILEVSVVTFTLILQRAYSLMAVLNNRANYLAHVRNNNNTAF